MPNILLVWECVPDDVNCYVIDSTHAAAQLARDSAGKYLNSGEDSEALLQLNDWIGTNEATDCLRDNDKPIEGPFSEVVICGFIM